MGGHPGDATFSGTEPQQALLQFGIHGPSAIGASIRRHTQHEGAIRAVSRSRHTQCVLWALATTPEAMQLDYSSPPGPRIGPIGASDTQAAAAPSFATKTRTRSASSVTSAAS